MTDPITTGWPPSELMQDDCKALSKWLASRPDARRRVREAIAQLDEAHMNQAAGLKSWELERLGISAENRPTQWGASRAGLAAPKELK